MIWDWSIHSFAFWAIGSLAVTAVMFVAGVEAFEAHDRLTRKRKDKHRP
jgi:hypothetical protein